MLWIQNPVMKQVWKSLLTWRECLEMFVEPRLICGVAPIVRYGCPHCQLKCITLILIDSEQRVEYTLLVCERVSISYLMDLYRLYRGIKGHSVPSTRIKSVTTLNVDRVLDPKEWLKCIQWARYQHDGHASSMEWFIARPDQSAFYYSLGDGGCLLVPRDNTQLEMLEIHRETVSTVAGLNVNFCKQPVVKVVDEFKSKLCGKL